MQIVEFPAQAVPPALLAQVLELHELAWPDPSGIAPDAPTHDPALSPWSMLLVDDTLVVAALDILSKEITHEGRHYRAGGLSTVVTRPSARGHGYGRRLVMAARETMAIQKLDLGLFTCDRPLRAFYESAGWRHLPGTVLIGGTPDAPFPSDQPDFDKVTMADFFSDRGKRGQATFVGARIALYPGQIDKLW